MYIFGNVIFFVNLLMLLSIVAGHEIERGKLAKLGIIKTWGFMDVVMVVPYLLSLLYAGATIWL